MKKIIALTATLFLSSLSAADIMLPVAQENQEMVRSIVKESVDQKIKNYSLKRPLAWGAAPFIVNPIKKTLLRKGYLFPKTIALHKKLKTIKLTPEEEEKYKAGLKKIHLYQKALAYAYLFSYIKSARGFWTIARYGSTVSIHDLVSDMLLRDPDHSYTNKIAIAENQKLNDRKYAYALKTTIPLWFANLLQNLMTQRFLFIDENGNAPKGDNKLFISVFGDNILDDFEDVMKEEDVEKKLEHMQKLAVKFVRFIYPNEG